MRRVPQPIFKKTYVAKLSFNLISTEMEDEMAVLISPVSFNLTIFFVTSFNFSCFCQTPLQLANPTQLQLVGEGVVFVFPQKKKKKGTTHT